jgi:hypothetical protein
MDYSLLLGTHRRRFPLARKFGGATPVLNFHSLPNGEGGDAEQLRLFKTMHSECEVFPDESYAVVAAGCAGAGDGAGVAQRRSSSIDGDGSATASPRANFDWRDDATLERTGGVGGSGSRASALDSTERAERTAKAIESCVRSARALIRWPPSLRPVLCALGRFHRPALLFRLRVPTCCALIPSLVTLSRLPPPHFKIGRQQLLGRGSPHVGRPIAILLSDHRHAAGVEFGKASGAHSEAGFILALWLRRQGEGHFVCGARNVPSPLCSVRRWFASLSLSLSLSYVGSPSPSPSFARSCPTDDC